MAPINLCLPNTTMQICTFSSIHNIAKDFSHRQQGESLPNRLEYIHTNWNDAMDQTGSLLAINQFVTSSDYCTTYEAVVGKTILKCTTKELSDMLKIPKGRISFLKVVPLTMEKKNQVFGVGVKKGKEGWNRTKALDIMAGWIPYISQ